MLSPLRNRAGRRLREPFGKAGLVVAIIALVFALGGGAWALSSSTSAGKQKAKISKTKRHARGIRGPQGPVGPEGPEGPAGVNGKNGTNGQAGANGTNGTPGKSVISGEEPAGANCTEGGYWFEIQGTGNKQYVCNGGGGSGGGGTLPLGQTLTGNWSFSVPKGGEEDGESIKALVSISYPLRAEFDFGIPDERWIGRDEWLEPGEEYDTEHCPGTAFDPEAAPGFLCFYAEAMVNAGEGPRRRWCGSPSGFGTSAGTTPRSGATAAFCVIDPTKQAYGYGTWAVSADRSEE
jgi:hypothetical protein